MAGTVRVASPRLAQAQAVGVDPETLFRRILRW